MSSSQSVSISNGQKQAEDWFDAFHFLPGQDGHIRWLSRPNQQFFQDTLTRDTEKFRITFDVENFQPDQIKIYIMNRQLTISGVYEERTEGCYMQKQFEKNFDIPEKADVEAMAAYITPAHMLVVEIPLTSNPQAAPKKVDLLSVDGIANNQRRLSFSLDKFNRLTNDGAPPPANSPSTLATPNANHQVRRTSITKTTTTTTTSGSPAGPSGLPAELAQLLLGENNSTNSNTLSSTINRTERRTSTSAPQQILINEPQSPPAPANNPTVMTGADLAKLGIDLPPELLAVGGTITIQKRRVSVTRTADPHANHPASPPPNLDSQSTTSKTTTTTTTSTNSNQTNPAGNRRPSSSSTNNTNNEGKSYTLEEFLQNKTWNPLIEDGPDGKKVLCLRLKMKPGTTVDHLRITLDGFVLRVEVNNSVTTATSGQTSEQSFNEVTLFPTCDVNQLRSVLKADGFLHIRVPIQLQLKTDTSISLSQLV